MTPDDIIIELQARMYGDEWLSPTTFYYLESLISKAIADEREACAKVCETHEMQWAAMKEVPDHWSKQYCGLSSAKDAAAAIRARK